MSLPDTVDVSTSVLIPSVVASLNRHDDSVYRLRLRSERGKRNTMWASRGYEQIPTTLTPTADTDTSIVSHRPSHPIVVQSMQDHRCLGTIGSLLLPPPRSHTFLRANTKAERDFRQEHGLCLFGPMLFVVCCRCAARQATARRPGVYVGNMNSHKEILVSAVSGLNTKIYPMDIFHFDFWRERKIFIAAQNINTAALPEELNRSCISIFGV